MAVQHFRLDDKDDAGSKVGNDKGEATATTATSTSGPLGHS